MKRTLLEILSGLAVLVLLASFHHRIGRLQETGVEVADLRGYLEERTAQLPDSTDLNVVRDELSALVDQRLAAIEDRVSKATNEARDATFLKQELELARKEAALLKSELQRNVSQTQDLVRSYHDQLSEQDKTALARVEANRDVIERLTGRVVPDKPTLTHELLSPTVQLNGDETVGSGTLVRSSRDERTGKTENWVLTSYHVVRNILADSPRSRHEGLAVTVYDTNGAIEVKGRMVAHDKAIDIALVELKTDRVFGNVARVLPRSMVNDVQVWDEIWAIGCPLGNDPIPTRGAISSTTNVLDGTNYWMINAPTYYGNSGGGIFLSDSRCLVGVFSKIYTHGRGTPVVVPHMGLCTPISAIYAWLDENDLDHVLPQHDAVLLRELAELAAPPR